ncbi:MAG: hypothetical protein AAFP76_02575 [Bacteroidota bacterium]
MMALSHKSKQYGLIALKVLILSLTFGYIYLKIKDGNGILLSEFLRSIQLENAFSLALFMGFAAGNWCFEILKWRTVTLPLQRLSFHQAMRQSLAALTVSLATPNRVGEYGAKAYFFPSKQRKQVLLLNFISNGAQMLITLFLGVIGLIIVIFRFDLSVSILKVMMGIVVFLVFVIAGYIFKEKELLVKGLSLAKVGRYIQNLPVSIKIRTLLYSFLRYILFGSLFYVLLSFFGAELSALEAAPMIMAMYLLVSVIPTIFVFDVVVRGGVALWLFSLANVSEWTVLSTVVVMWVLNFVLPAIWGSFYVLTYRNS